MNITYKLSNSIATSLNKHLNKSAIELEKITYGLRVLLINLLKLISLTIVAYFLGMIKYSLIFFLCFGLVRSFAFGLHAERSLNCTISNLIIFIGGAYLSTMIDLSNIAVVFLFLINYLLLFKYAPADTKSRPIPSITLRRKLKIKSLTICTILFISAFVFKSDHLREIITLSVFTESLCITPLTYKIFNKEYDNYEKFNVK